MAPEKKSGNGVEGTATEPVDRIVLTYNRTTDLLNIDHKTSSLDLALDMLYRARRAFEFEQRKAQALQIQAAAIKQAEEAAIAAALRNKR